MGEASISSRELILPSLWYSGYYYTPILHLFFPSIQWFNIFALNTHTSYSYGCHPITEKEPSNVKGHRVWASENSFFPLVIFSS